MLSIIEVILIVAAVILITANRTHAAHSGAECYLHGHRRPLDGPRPRAIGVKAHHVFQVIRVVDRDHVLAISGNDHNDVRTRIRPTSDVIGWRDVTEEASRV